MGCELGVDDVLLGFSASGSGGCESDGALRFSYIAGLALRAALLLVLLSLLLLVCCLCCWIRKLKR